MSDSKKIAATMAVLKLLRQEEIRLETKTMPYVSRKTQTPWAMCGRQSQLQLRQAMQLKGFHRK